MFEKKCSLVCLFLQDFLPFGTDLFQHAEHPLCGEKKSWILQKVPVGKLMETKQGLDYLKGSAELLFHLGNILELPSLALVLPGPFGLSYPRDPVEIQNSWLYGFQQL